MTVILAVIVFVLSANVLALLIVAYLQGLRLTELSDHFDRTKELHSTAFLDVFRKNRELSEKVARLEKWANGDRRLDSNDDPQF